jgi:hypothetical protein
MRNKKVNMFWTNKPVIKGLVIFVLSFAAFLVVNLLVFQVTCDYNSRGVFCWENKPNWIHPGWVLPLTLAIMGLMVYLLVTRSNR